MSKSKGEFLTVSLIKSKGYNPLDYRYFCLNSHYRNSLVFSYESLDIAKNAFSKLKTRILGIEKSGEIDLSKKNEYLIKFGDAIKNDLNTSLMLTVLYDLLKDSSVNGATKIDLIQDFDRVLSLDLLKEEVKNVDSTLENEILVKIEERTVAKKNRDFVTADKIRDELLIKGIKLIDTREGTLYEII